MSCGQELLEGGKKEAVVEVEGNEIAVQVWGSQCRLAHAFQLRDELVRTLREAMPVDAVALSFALLGYTLLGAVIGSLADLKSRAA